MAATKNPSLSHLTHFLREILHGVHYISPSPPNITKHQVQDPISQKKLAKVEGTWKTLKEILGWIIDGANFTLQLMPDKCKKIVHLFKKVCKLK